MQCFHCDTEKAKYVCAGCKVVAYCGSSCALENWKENDHKQHCSIIQQCILIGGKHGRDEEEEKYTIEPEKLLELPVELRIIIVDHMWPHNHQGIDALWFSPNEELHEFMEWKFNEFIRLLSLKNRQDVTSYAATKGQLGFYQWANSKGHEFNEVNCARAAQNGH